MADMVFVSARRAMKQAMSKMYKASVRLDLAEMGARNFVRSSCDLNDTRRQNHKWLTMNKQQDHGFAWPTSWSERGEFFAPKKILVG